MPRSGEGLFENRHYKSRLKPPQAQAIGDYAHRAHGHGGGGKGRVNQRLLLANQVIIVGVAADPKPQHAIRDVDTQGAIREADTDGPKAANLFKMQGGVTGVAF